MLRSLCGKSHINVCDKRLQSKLCDKGHTNVVTRCFANFVTNSKRQWIVNSEFLYGNAPPNLTSCESPKGNELSTWNFFTAMGCQI